MHNTYSVIFLGACDLVLSWKKARRKIWCNFSFLSVVLVLFATKLYVEFNEWFNSKPQGRNWLSDVRVVRDNILIVTFSIVSMTIFRYCSFSSLRSSTIRLMISDAPTLLASSTVVSTSYQNYPNYTMSLKF